MEKVLKDLGLIGRSLYSLPLSMYGLVEGLLGAHEDRPTRQVALQGLSNVGKDSMQDHIRHQCGQLHFLLLKFPHHPLQQLIAAGMLSYAQAELLG
jgi:hypothetical protein